MRNIICKFCFTFGLRQRNDICHKLNDLVALLGANIPGPAVLDDSGLLELPHSDEKSFSDSYGVEGKHFCNLS